MYEQNKSILQGHTGGDLLIYLFMYFIGGGGGGEWHTCACITNLHESKM